MNEVLHQNWNDLLQTWGVAPQADHTFEEIAQAYSGPDRFYHTLDHVLNMLGTVENLATHASNLNAVKLATWLHDVIYDSKGSDNEACSADYALGLCEELAIPEAMLLLTSFRKRKRMMPVTTLMPKCSSTPTLPSWVRANRITRSMQREFGVSTPGWQNRNIGKRGGGF